MPWNLFRNTGTKNHPNEPTPKITSHYIKTSWEPMEVSSTPCTTTTFPDDFWEPYDDEESDASSSEKAYFPTSNDELLWHRDLDEIDYEDKERLWFFRMRE